MMDISLTNYSNRLYRDGLKTLYIDDVEIYFSWGNVIGFRMPDGERVLRANKEGYQSTGAHLNTIDRDKKKRIDADRFDQLVKNIFRFSLVEEDSLV